MIKTKEDLRHYLQEDKNWHGKKRLFIKWLTRSDDLYVVRFMYALRHYEYYLNKQRGILDIIPYYFWWWNYRRLKLKSGLFIVPNVLGAGVDIVHPGFVRISGYVKIGNNCTILPMVLFGKKKPNEESDIIVGDNVYISTGVTILGPVTIGNNVTIGAGAVVNKDVPDNCVIGGVPAKLLKYKE